jgi:hypothetical protein
MEPSERKLNLWDCAFGGDLGNLSPALSLFSGCYKVNKPLLSYAPTMYSVSPQAQGDGARQL